MTQVRRAFQPKEMRSPRPSPRRLALLGATGSIGRQVCDLVERHPERFALHAVIAGTDAAALEAVVLPLPGIHSPPGTTRGAPACRAARAASAATYITVAGMAVGCAAGGARLGR